MLVAGCFECFGFPVKCAEVNCFLEVVFYGFSIVPVAWDTIFIILGVQTLSFDRPSASIFLPGGPFCQLGDTREDHGRTHEAHNQIFSDFA